MNFSETLEFKKDFKRLAKKYRSLSDDLREFKKVVSKIPEGNSRFFAHLNRTESTVIVKTRLFCKYLKGRSLRVVYAYHRDRERIVFIELYFKGDKEREDQARIDRYCDDLAE